MAKDQQPTKHAENADHEAVLTGVIALANLFSNCVEAFGLIHSVQRWDQQEQLLLVRVGIQQARLLIWGDVVGISSPPATVTDRAVPLHPSAAYPDLSEPTFFQARDVRLEEPQIRTDVENALSAIVDRSSSGSREEMMNNYGLKPPKKYSHGSQPALDTNRLEAFREHYELLKEVAESYAQLNTRRNASIVQTSWQIANFAKFDSFIRLTREKIDHLIQLLDLKDRVDRGMCMDIKAIGWHLTADRVRISGDVAKLKLIREACKDEYPEYIAATDQALANIEREKLENSGSFMAYSSAEYAPVHQPLDSAAPPRRGSLAYDKQEDESTSTSTPSSPTTEKPKKHGLFGGLFKHSRKSSQNVPKARSQSVANSSSEPRDPERSLSDSGPTKSSTDHSMEPIRSKSVGAILDTPVNNADEHMLKAKLEKMNTNTTSTTISDGDGVGGNLDASISRHDLYHGLGRQGTRAQ